MKSIFISIIEFFMLIIEKMNEPFKVIVYPRCNGK